MDKEQTISYLCTTIETGKEKNAQAVIKAGFSWEDFRIDTLKLIDSLNEDELFSSQLFYVAIRLAITRCYKKAREEKSDWMDILRAELEELFNSKWADNIYLFTLAVIKTFVTDGDKQLLTKEEYDNYCQEQKRLLTLIVQKHVPQRQRGHIRPTSPQSHISSFTWMEKCPECGKEKEVNIKTKRLNCDHCGHSERIR